MHCNKELTNNLTDNNIDNYKKNGNFNYSLLNLSKKDVSMNIAKE